MTHLHREFRHDWGAVLALAIGLLVSGCSLATRPDANEDGHVECSLRYLPDARAEHDLEFRAWSTPYDPEDYLLSLPDQLVHSAFAPGRHLTSDLAITGADCSGSSWRKGYRLPMKPSLAAVVRCSRRADTAVTFRVETKWGSCSAELLAAGDAITYRHSAGDKGSR